MYSVLLANDNLTNEVQLIRDYTASITSACDAISTDSASMQALLQVRSSHQFYLLPINHSSLTILAW